MSGSSSSLSVFLVDFDQTIIRQNLFHIIESRFLGHEPNAEEQVEFVNTLLSSKKIEFIEYDKMRDLLVACLDNGVKVIICTFNPFIAAIKEVLKFMKIDVDSIEIISRPKSSKARGKDIHIEKAITETEKRHSTCIERLIYLDDDPAVINAAADYMQRIFERIYYRGVVAAPDPYALNIDGQSRYLSEVYNMLELPLSRQFILPQFESNGTGYLTTTPVKANREIVKCYKSKKPRIIDMNHADDDDDTEADSRSSSRCEQRQTFSLTFAPV